MFLILESFGYSNNNGDFVTQQCLRKVSDLNYYWSQVHEEVSSSLVWKLPRKEMAKVYYSHGLIGFIGLWYSQS